LRLQRDDKTKKVRQVWVRWEGRSNFSASSAADRHYVVERTRGRLQFGDGRAGMLPPVNPNNVLVTYRSGGGVIGNIPPRTIQVVLGSIPGAQKVFNPIAAAGGADGELVRKPADAQNSLASAAAILRRGPQLVRHRYRALTPLDYEQLALAASPGVACARVVAPADATCDISAGNVRVLVVPVANETDPEPVPSRQLCLEVQTYLRARMPATAQLEVTAPTYFPVGVEAMLTPRAPEAAGELARQARAGILKFLHPVVGGPKGQGWPFNADVHRSDLVAFLHRQLGELLAFVEQIYLLNAGVPAAEELQIPADRLPCAGPIRIRLSANAEVST
jgi:predicted phage baseplate assembly protein